MIVLTFYCINENNQRYIVLVYRKELNKDHIYLYILDNISIEIPLNELSKHDQFLFHDKKQLRKINK